MERILGIIKAEDFNLALTNLLIDLYSPDYEKHFQMLWFDLPRIDKLTPEEKDKLTKLAAIIEYVGNRQPKAKLYEWIYSDQLRLQAPYTPGVENESLQRIRRIDINTPRTEVYFLANLQPVTGHSPYSIIWIRRDAYAQGIYHSAPGQLLSLGPALRGYV